MTRILLLGASLLSLPDGLPAQSKDCLPCHVRVAEGINANRMTRALSSAAAQPIPVAGQVLSTTQDGYDYRIWRDGQHIRYHVKGPDGNFETTLDWAFGTGFSGITWTFQRDALVVESRVSYFPSLAGLQLTIGAANSRPHNLAEAAGRVMGRRDTAECFHCHSSNGVQGMDVNWTALIPGITCQRCHGEVKPHLQALSAKSDDKGIRHPGRGTAEEINEFCGACHRTWADVVNMRLTGISTIRFQPYRIVGSKCYDADDRRISCIACHDPHKALETSTAAYDGKCLACHDQGRKCRAGTSGCASCHMLKLEMPGAFEKFTDHRIRVARQGEPFPD